MKWLIPLAAALLLAVFLFLTFQPSDRRSSTDYAREDAEAQRIAQAAQLDAQAAPVVATAWLVTRVAFILMLPIGAALGGAAALARFRYERRPDARGLLPLPAYNEGAAVAALAGFHQTEYTRAAIAPVPHSTSNSTHYAPHYAPALHSGAYTDRAALDAPIELPSLTSTVIPSFAALLDSGRIGRDNPLLLGIGAEGRPVDGSWLDLFSVAIGGLSGSGKSWTGAMLLSQAMLHGARVALLDPHSGDSEALSTRLAPLAGTGRYLCDVASDGRAMLATVKMLSDELERRKSGKGTREPWIVCADEFSALMRGDVAEPLSLLFEAIAQEGRKLGIYGLALGQSWTASRSGGTELRDSLASCYLHRLRPSQARYLSGLTADDLPDDLLELPAGTAYLLSTRGELQRLTIPQMTAGDVVRVASALTSTGAEARPTSATVGPIGKTDGSLMEARAEVTSTATERATAASAEARTAAAHFLDGDDLATVVFKLRNVTSNQGRRYQQAAQEVQALIREGLK